MMEALLERRIRRTAAAAMVLGAMASWECFVRAADGGRRFYANWIMWALFLLSIALGAMFWTATLHLTEARWSVPLRRVPERLSALLWWLLPAGLVALLGVGSLYPWASPEALYDPLLRKKAAYLNLPFFVVRAGACFFLWLLFFRLLAGASVRQDQGRAPAFARRAKFRAALFMVVFGVTVSVAGFDWLMSIEPRWYSTVMGVYFFSECAVSGLAAVTLTALYLKRRGRLPGIRPDHLYNLGALLFGFSAFWAYIAYSQMMLIWYGNIPDETIFYLKRAQGGWVWASALLPVVHFLVPFFALLSRPAKSDEKRLAWVSLMLLFSVLLSLYWFIFPALGQGVLFGLTEAAAALFFAGGGVLCVIRSLSFGPDMPERDPNLKEGLEFSL